MATLVQLLALYTDPENHNAQRYRQTDRQTDGRHDDANSGSYCVAVRSAKTKLRRRRCCWFADVTNIRGVMSCSDQMLKLEISVVYFLMWFKCISNDARDVIYWIKCILSHSFSANAVTVLMRQALVGLSPSYHVTLSLLIFSFVWFHFHNVVSNDVTITSSLRIDVIILKINFLFS